MFKGWDRNKTILQQIGWNCRLWTGFRKNVLIKNKQRYYDYGCTSK